ncbi:MAG: fasciclin domain-containing protein, partial [Bacteroidaceae bacterium]|nr:fasciclin domain-containing protein [Bacteroidaceae bacterium]
MMTSCEKELLVPEDSKPAWLGASIYEELRSGTHLTGTFNTYLKLVDDLGYAEVLSRTGSKTIFPANDEAFDRFFQNCPYKKSNGEPVRVYGDLTEGMKKQLLYSSMLDNAMLAGMLSNIRKDDNNVTRGEAIKHETNISVTDSITLLTDGAKMPQNNTYWDSYRKKGINVVYDATKPMMVHFTREQMLQKSITTTGTDCDFAILRGEPVGTSILNSDTAYIYQTKIINQDVTCINGYVHQVSDVLVPPGNIGQVMRNEKNTQLMSRIFDYFCAPYYDEKTTKDYNAWAMQNARPLIDSVFQVRYFTGGRSQGGNVNVTDPLGSIVDDTKRLEWDLGWNQYYPSTNSANNLSDMGAILVPTDDAVKEYFLPGGGGAYFIELYGTMDNTEENLPYNLDALHNNGNGILTSFVNNLIQNSFVNTVPSKFGTLTNDGSGDFMGLTRNDIQVTDGKYDVVVANNGVIYKMKSMIAPDEFQSVLGPAITYPDMSVMGYFTKDKTSGTTQSIFGADMYYYLMAMKANYLYFIPSDIALQGCFIDPISLESANPRALEFYSHVEPVPGTERMQTIYGVKIHNYNPTTGVIDPAIRETVQNIVSNSKSDFASQVYDMLNYNT